MPSFSIRSTPAVTLDKIARGLKLSRVTVSSVINGKARQRRISDATVARVNAFLTRSGFVPSRQAVNLRSQTRDTVGILHTGYLYSHLTEAFNRMAQHYSHQPAGLEIMVVSPDQILAGLRELIARRIRNLVWIQTFPPQIELLDPPTLFGLLSNVTTVIYNHSFDKAALDRELIKRGIYLVGADRRHGYEALASRLQALGHRCVALPDIDSGWRSAAVPNIVSHFVNVFETRGIRTLPCCPPRMPDGDTAAMGRRMAEAVMAVRRQHPVTAACFRDDEICAFALRHLIDHDVRIPRDLSVTGFDGLALAPAFRVGLTTLRIPVAEMVQRTFRLIERRPRTFRHQLDVPLIERESLGPPPTSRR